MTFLILAEKKNNKQKLSYKPKFLLIFCRFFWKNYKEHKEFVFKYCSFLYGKIKTSLFQKQSSGVFCKEVFLETSQNLQENTYQRLFFNKVVDLRPATLLKKRLSHMCFPVNFAKYLRITFLFNRTLLVTASSIPRETRRRLAQPMSKWNSSHFKRN